MQIGMPPVTSQDALGPLLVPDDPTNPTSRTQVKATAAQQRCAASGPPACVSLAEATLAYPVSKEKTSAMGIPQKYLSKQLTTSLYACTFEGCDRIFKQLAGIYNHLCHLHLGVAVGCYQGTPTVRPLSFRSGFGATSCKKAQVSAAVDSKTASSTSVVDDFPGDETQSSTSIKDDEEDDIPPVLSPLPHDCVASCHDCRGC